MKSTLTRVSAWAFALIVFTFQACMPEQTSQLEEQMAADEEAIVDYLDKNNISAEKAEGGYFFMPLEENASGKEIAAGDVVEFYYTISTLEGKELASNQDASKPLLVKHQAQKLGPVGVDMALTKMKVGETFRLFIPSYLAYYESSAEGFSSFTNFIVDIKVADAYTEEIRKAKEDTIIRQYAEKFIETENLGLDRLKRTDSGLYYVIITEGTGEKPATSSRVYVNYTGWLLDGKKFDSSYDRNSSFNFVLGVGEVIPGWDEGIAELPKGSTARLFIPSHLAYGAKVVYLPAYLSEKDPITSHAILDFSVELMEN